MTHNFHFPTYVQITLQLYNTVHQLLYTTNDDKKWQYFTTSYQHHLEWLQHSFPNHKTVQRAGKTSTNGSRATLLRGADLWQWCSTQVLRVLRGDPLVLRTLPPGKLTSLEFNIIEENEPLFELGFQKQTRVAYTVVFNKQFPICDHESEAALVVNRPWHTRNWRDCAFRRRRRRRSCAVLQLTWRSWTAPLPNRTESHITHVDPTLFRWTPSCLPVHKLLNTFIKRNNTAGNKMLMDFQAPGYPYFLEKNDEMKYSPSFYL